MKKYVSVLLKTGTNPTTNRAHVDSLFAGHLANIGRLADLGKLIIAGPLGKNANSYRCIFVLNVSSVDETQQLLKTDPAIIEELLDPETYTWYGSAALRDYLPVHDKIYKLQP